MEIKPTNLPSFDLRLSKKAKRIFLSISALKGLQIITPKILSEQEINRLLIEKKTWIDKHAHLISQFNNEKSLIGSLATQLDLLAINRIIKLEYEVSPQKFIDIILNQENKIIFRGKIGNNNIIYKILKSWLMQRAHEILIPWLFQLSIKYDLSYNEVKIKKQTTIWGSCTTKKNISLNCNLLFLPPHLVQHILLHELTHTIHLNHSQRFWDLLRQYDPNCDLHKKLLKKSQEYVPNWAN
ncbi:MAG: hypothetical protein JWM09_633 [Francisellaceae bacterium]|nr:hypothetical protein [Francisellaceae bacterium]